MPSRPPPSASASALSKANAKAQRQAGLDASHALAKRRATGKSFVGISRAGDGGPIHGAMYDQDDDPDRLYYSRGLGRLDSDDDSGDDDSDVPRDAQDDQWGDELGASGEHRDADDADFDDADETQAFHPLQGGSAAGRPGFGTSSTYRRPSVSYDLNPPDYVAPVEETDGGAAGSDRSDDDEPEVKQRFEWQHMLNNVLQGNVLKSEKTRLSTASLSGTKSLKNGFTDGFNSTRRQRAYAIWLLLRAKVRGRTSDEEGRFLEEARSKVDDVIDELAKFKVAELVQEPGGVHLDAGVVQRNAADQVSSLLKRVDWCESLYPSRRALATEKERVVDDEITRRLDALRTWQQITKRLKVTVGILKKWTGGDWEKLSRPGTFEDPEKNTTATGLTNDRGFIAVIVREDSLQSTFEKRILTDLYALVDTAKSAILELQPVFSAMNLPGFTDDLFRLAIFPSRLAQEALRTTLESVSNIHDPSVVLIDQLTADLRKGLEVACQIKRQYTELATPDPDAGWSLQDRLDGYEETLLATLRFFFKLLHWKLKSPSKAIYFKETEIVENEWGFLSNVTEEIDSGDLLVGEHFRCAKPPLPFDGALDATT